MLDEPIELLSKGCRVNVSPAVLGSSPRRTGVYQYMYMYSLIRLFSRTRSNWLPNMLNTPSQAPSHLQLSASAEPAQVAPECWLSFLPVRVQRSIGEDLPDKRACCRPRTHRLS